MDDQRTNSSMSELKDVNTVLDGFSGTTRVSQAFAQLGYYTTANDISIWSDVFAHCFLKSSKKDSFYQELINHLNSLKGVDGWYTEHYGSDLPAEKKPFNLKILGN